MDRKDFFFHLPPGLIAQRPEAARSDARLMTLDRRTGAVAHKRFHELALSPGDCLVLNDSRVIPARLIGETASGAKMEMLLHERLDGDRWTVLVKPGRKARVGDRLIFGQGALTAYVEDMAADGLRVARLAYDGPFELLLARIGTVPLPHYIRTDMPPDEVRTRYQTVYAAHDGSVAAPTAGLHFTDALLTRLQAEGVRVARLTLHVGLGTFRPVKADDITRHTMHREYYHIAPDQAAIINDAKKNGGRIAAVGTTTCRTLESRAAEDGTITPGAGHTDIFIYPGYTFKAVDVLITNFHLPESTLLMLVSAFAGRERALAAYAAAIEAGYRFYSFGDAMVIG